MLPKSKYMKLSSAEKAKVKRKLGMKKSSSASSSFSKFKGHGDYYRYEPSKKGMFTKTGSPFSGAGAQLGEKLLGRPGKYIGGAAHALFKSITGFGDYKVSSNSILAGNSPPSFGSMGRGTIVRHREYIGDILSTTAFTIAGYPINAGLSGSFPWLSTCAANYEQYCIRGMVFQFKTTSATSLTSGTSTAMGTVIMATQYNSVAPAFTSKVEMENHEFSTNAKPSDSFMHPIECARGETPVSCLYMRQAAVPSGADQRLYDLGTLYIATQGQQHAGDVIGELHVTYDIELLKPRIQSPALLCMADHYQIPATATGTVPNQFGTTVPTPVAGSNLGTVLRNSVTATIAFPVSAVDSVYLVEYSLYGGQAAVSTAPTITAYGGCSEHKIFNADTVGLITATASDAWSKAWFSAAVFVPAGQASPTINIGAFTPPTSVTGGDLIISCLPSGIVTRTRPPVVRRVPKSIDVPEGKSEEKDDEESSDDDRYEDPEYLEFLLQKANAKKAKASKAAELKASLPEMPKHLSLPEEEDAVLVKKPVTPAPQRVASRK